MRCEASLNREPAKGFGCLSDEQAGLLLMHANGVSDEDIGEAFDLTTDRVAAELRAIFAILSRRSE